MEIKVYRTSNVWMVTAIISEKISSTTCVTKAIAEAYARGIAEGWKIAGKPPANINIED